MVVLAGILVIPFILLEVHISKNRVRSYIWPIYMSCDFPGPRVSVNLCSQVADSIFIRKSIMSTSIVASIGCRHFGSL